MQKPVSPTPLDHRGLIQRPMVHLGRFNFQRLVAEGRPNRRPSDLYKGNRTAVIHRNSTVGPKSHLAWPLPSKARESSPPPKGYDRSKRRGGHISSSSPPPPPSCGSVNCVCLFVDEVGDWRLEMATRAGVPRQQQRGVLLYPVYGSSFRWFCQTCCSRSWDLIMCRNLVSPLGD